MDGGLVVMDKKRDNTNKKLNKGTEVELTQTEGLMKAEELTQNAELTNADSTASVRKDKRKQVRVHIGTSASTFALNIIGFSADEMLGTIVHMYSNRTYEFNSVFEMVNLIHAISEQLDFPQKGYRIRSWYSNGDDEETGTAHQFRKMDLSLKAADIKSNRATKAKLTFLVRIQYRQNASWQGEILWHERERTVKFRSLLELLTVLDEAKEEVRLKRGTGRKK